MPWEEPSLSLDAGAVVAALLSRGFLRTMSGVNDCLWSSVWSHSVLLSPGL